MRQILLLFCLTATLGAQAALRIVAVTRKGLPPYQLADRIYRLEGAETEALRVGQRLQVRREGRPQALGHLCVTEVQAGGAEATFQPSGALYPMKGDTAWLVLLPPLPEVPGPGIDPAPLPAGHSNLAEAPPREGLLYFLPQQSDLSPAGREKLQTWVAAWGTGGRWAVQLPATPALSPALQLRRAGTLQQALRTLGIPQAAVETGARTAEGRYDPAWIRHWD